MDASEIYRALWSNYHNSDYKLQNKFVFDWESDFFFMSKSGYAVEVEVKISRSDFKADFDKPKHRLFEDAFAGKSHHIDRRHTSANYGPYKDGEAWERIYKRDEWRIIRRIEDIDSTPDPSYELISEKKTTTRVQDKYPFQYIRIISMEKVIMPNRFIYVVPEGLIDRNDVPDYAGLSYYRPEWNDIKTIKKPPFLHKRCMISDMAAILRDKFYYLSLEQRSEIHQMKYIIEDLQKQKQ